MSEFDTEYTREPICPHCGKAVSDAWELTENYYREWECGWCCELFVLERHISVLYSTAPLLNEKKLTGEVKEKG